MHVKRWNWRRGYQIRNHWSNQKRDCCGNDDDCMWLVSYNQTLGGTKSGKYFPFSIMPSGMVQGPCESEHEGIWQPQDFIIALDYMTIYCISNYCSLPWTCPLKQSDYSLQRRQKELKKLRQKYNVPVRFLLVKKSKYLLRAHKYQEDNRPLGQASEQGK